MVGPRLGNYSRSQYGAWLIRLFDVRLTVYAEAERESSVRDDGGRQEPWLASMRTTKGTRMLLGLTTVSFWADDLVAARRWCAELLGVQPYFERPNSEHPAYIEFRLGDYQHGLGIIDRRYAPCTAAADPGGAVVYWHVDEVATALEKVKAMGATEYEPLINREAGFITASMVDPFGNVLGLMYNPHYLKIFDSTTEA